MADGALCLCDVVVATHAGQCLIFAFSALFCQIGYISYLRMRMNVRIILSCTRYKYARGSHLLLVYSRPSAVRAGVGEDVTSFLSKLGNCGNIEEDLY